MHVWIKRIILWPKNTEKDLQIIELKNNRINIIYGDSRTGKSSLIPIIDYCLGSSDYRIPVGTIRDNTAWFGVLLQSGDQEMLLCRAEPGQHKQTSRMYYALGNNLIIPKQITENTTTDDIKDLLNQHFGFTALPITVNGHHDADRPSFRDVAAFLYQPQNIIANPEALFYKLDELEHKQKLANIFPFLAGAVTAEDLMNELELIEVGRKLRRLEKESATLEQVSLEWRNSVEEQIIQALEFGISNFDLDLSNGFDEMLNEIRRLSSLSHSEILNATGSTNLAISRLNFLRSKEEDLSIVKNDILRRLSVISETISYFDQYGSMIDSLGDYTGISEWLLGRVSQEDQCPICGQRPINGQEILEKIESLYSKEADNNLSLEKVRMELTKEKSTLNKQLDETVEELRATSITLRSLEEKQNKSKYQLYEIERFIGELKASLMQYEAISQCSDNGGEIEKLAKRQAELRKRLNETNVLTKIHAAIQKISSYTKDMLQSLDMENSEWEVHFDYKNLALKIVDNKDTSHFLNEIGSASNWLSYHVAFSLALQRYLQTHSPLTIPSFVFYDQPSQVYFPHIESLLEVAADKTDADREAVRKIFEAFDDFLTLENFDFQIIVTEHAGADIWGEVNLDYEVGHWTHDEKKLIPDEWLKSEE